MKAGGINWTGMELEWRHDWIGRNWDGALGDD